MQHILGIFQYTISPMQINERLICSAKTGTNIRRLPCDIMSQTLGTSFGATCQLLQCVLIN